MNTNAPAGCSSSVSPVSRFLRVTAPSLPLPSSFGRNSTTSRLSKTSIVGVIITLSWSSLLAVSRSLRCTIVTLSTNCVRNNPSSRPLLPPPRTTSWFAPL